MEVSNGDGDGGRVDEDGSGGNSPSRQSAKTETSVPRILSAMVAALRNSSWNMALYFRVFDSEGINRRRGEAGRCTECPHHPWARPRLGFSGLHENGNI